MNVLDVTVLCGTCLPAPGPCVGFRRDGAAAGGRGTLPRESCSRPWSWRPLGLWKLLGGPLGESSVFSASLGAEHAPLRLLLRG